MTRFSHCKDPNKWGLAFSLMLLGLIVYTFFFSIPTGHGEIGISADVLNIGDRAFYINDDDPFTDKIRNGSFNASPLYPFILRSISFVSGNLFGSNTVSNLWNFILIFICSLLAIATQRLIYESGIIIGGKSVGIISMLLFIFSPYTYFYVLSGSLTMFILFGTSLVSYSYLRLNNCRLSLDNSEKINQVIPSVLLGIGAIYMLLLRPTSLVFASIILLTSFFSSAKSLKIGNWFKISFWQSILFSALVLLGAHLLIQGLEYVRYSYSVFSLEQGTFFGYPRELLRLKLHQLSDLNNAFSDAKSTAYWIAWKITDFVTGAIDIRDTHDATNFQSLLPFLSRILSGVFYLAPITLLSVLSMVVNRRLIISSGLGVLLIAVFISVSPSLMGVSMSRYLYMFYTPHLLSAGILIQQLYRISCSKI